MRQAAVCLAEDFPEDGHGAWTAAVVIPKLCPWTEGSHQAWGCRGWAAGGLLCLRHLLRSTQKLNQILPGPAGTFAEVRQFLEMSFYPVYFPSHRLSEATTGGDSGPQVAKEGSSMVEGIKTSDLGF